MKTMIITIFFAGLVACSRGSVAADADNTIRNQSDRSGSSITPTDQGESEVDRQLTRAARESLMDDSALSMNAKNVKIVTRDGRVTLRGVVDSADERARVVAAVNAVVGIVACDDQLEVRVK